MQDYNRISFDLSVIDEEDSKVSTIGEQSLDFDNKFKDIVQEKDDEIKSLRDKLAQCQSSADELAAKLQVVEEIHSEQQFVLLEQIAQAEIDFEKKNAELDQAHEQLKVFEVEVNKLSLEKDTLEAANDKTELLEQITKAEMNLGQKNAELNQAHEQLKAHEVEISKLVAEKNSLEAANDKTELFEKIAKFEMDLDKKNAELDQVNEQLKASEAEISKLVAEKNSLEAANDKTELFEKIAKAEIDFEAKSAELDQAHEQLKTFEVEVNKLSLEKILLEEAKDKAERKIVEIAKRSQVESDEFDQIEGDLRKENFDLKRELISFKYQQNLITEEQACIELGCDLTKVV